MTLSLGKGPLYMQVQEAIKKRIINGEYPIGSFIPAEPRLKDEFKVSMITVRRAVEELAIQGYVEKQSGIGTTVLENNAISKLSKGQGFSAYLHERGHVIKKEFISAEKMKVEEGTELANYFTEECQCIERLYLLNDAPYIHFKHFIPKDITLPTGDVKFEDSLYEIMYNEGIEFKQFKDEFSVGVPDAEIASKLQVEQVPLLKRVRYSYDINHHIIEYSVAYYNSDIHKYVVNFDI